MKNTAKHQVKTKSKKYILILIFAILIVLIFTYYKYYTNKQNNDILDDIKIDETQISDAVTKKMLQLRELKKQNSDIVAWLEIANTKIDYPVLQTTDNEYYMTHTYQKEYSADGSIFLDKD